MFIYIIINDFYYCIYFQSFFFYSKNVKLHTNKKKNNNYDAKYLQKKKVYFEGFYTENYVFIRHLYVSKCVMIKLTDNTSYVSEWKHENDLLATEETTTACIW